MVWWFGSEFVFLLIILDEVRFVVVRLWYCVLSNCKFVVVGVLMLCWEDVFECYFVVR